MHIFRCFPLHYWKVIINDFHIRKTPHEVGQCTAAGIGWFSLWCLLIDYNIVFPSDFMTWCLTNIYLLFVAVSSGDAEGDVDCASEKCDIVFTPECPDDSVLVGGHITAGHCCPEPQSCQCNPLHCLEPICAHHERKILVAQGTGSPGACCDVYQCRPEGKSFTVITYSIMKKNHEFWIYTMLHNVLTVRPVLAVGI